MGFSPPKTNFAYADLVSEGYAAKKNGKHMAKQPLRRSDSGVWGRKEGGTWMLGWKIMYCTIGDIESNVEGTILSTRQIPIQLRVNV